MIRLIAGAAMRMEAMGFGDVTLMAMVGAFLGWQVDMDLLLCRSRTGHVLCVGHVHRHARQYHAVRSLFGFGNRGRVDQIRLGLERVGDTQNHDDWRLPSVLGLPFLPGFTGRNIVGMVAAKILVS